MVEIPNIEDRESRAIPVSSESRILWTLERGSRTGGLLSLLTDYTRVDVHIYVGGRGKYGQLKGVQGWKIMVRVCVVPSFVSYSRSRNFGLSYL